jgi:hypothetical protein
MEEAGDVVPPLGKAGAYFSWDFFAMSLKMVFHTPSNEVSRPIWRRVSVFKQ